MTLTISVLHATPMLRLSGDVGALVEMPGVEDPGDRFVVQLDDGTRLTGAYGRGFDPADAAGVRFEDYHSLGTFTPPVTIANGVALVDRRVRWVKAAAPSLIAHAEKISGPTIANDDMPDPDPAEG